MLKKWYVSLVLAIILLSFSIVTVPIAFKTGSRNCYAITLIDRTQSSTISPIVINSDTDFVSLSLSGNGTALYPYMLSDLVIQGETCISISDTSSYFKIENCTLLGNQYGIFLHNVSNSILILNSINASVAIRIDHSNNCTVIDNTVILGQLSLQSSSHCLIQNNSMTCMEISYCTNISICNHTLYGPDIGIYLTHCDGINIINNTLGRDYGWFLTLDNCFNCLVFRNNLASYSDITAIDLDGANNTWDDGISQGNGWYDYNGTGTYSIPGDSGSVDRYPSHFIPPLSIDYHPPVIEAFLQHSYYDVCSFPFYLYFEANVSDYSGVNTVLVLGFGKMKYSPTATNPNRYILSVGVYTTSQYYRYWANDTLGYSSESGEGYISVNHYNCIPTTPDTGSGNPQYNPFLFAEIFLIFAIPVTLLYWFGRYKQRAH